MELPQVRLFKTVPAPLIDILLAKTFIRFSLDSCQEGRLT